MAGSGRGAGGRVLHSAQAEDVASASNFRAFELLHLHLDLRAEFGPPGPGPGCRGLSGSAVLDLRCLEPGGAAELRLDSHPCVEVTAAALRRERPDAGQPEPEPEPVPVCTRPFSHYGQALCVRFPQPCIAGERLRVQLTYRVGEGPGVSAPAPRRPLLPPLLVQMRPPHPLPPPLPSLRPILIQMLPPPLPPTAPRRSPLPGWAADGSRTELRVVAALGLGWALVMSCSAVL